MQFLEGSESDRVQRNGSRVSILGFGQMDLSTLEVDLAPIQTILLAQPLTHEAEVDMFVNQPRQMILWT